MHSCENTMFNLQLAIMIAPCTWKRQANSRTGLCSKSRSSVAYAGVNAFLLRTDAAPG